MRRQTPPHLFKSLSFTNFAVITTKTEISMKTLKTAIITLLTLAAIACTGDKAPAIPERIVEDVNTETGVISLRDYSISDTIAIGGKIFNYTYTLEHVDTLPTLINPQGLEYHESRVSIKVSRGDEQIFNKKFLNRLNLMALITSLAKCGISYFHLFILRLILS